jgi:hypothetical protein
MHPDDYRLLDAPMSHPPFADDLMRYKVQFSLGTSRMTHSLASLGATMAAYGTKVRDLDWRINWYRDPGAAWWEQ